jgi:iron-sulfur cluster assembly protein
MLIMGTQQAIMKTMTIEDVFTSNPSKAQKLAQVMTNAGLHCVGCDASNHETIEQGMVSHGIQEEKIEELVLELNSVLDEGEIQEKGEIGFTEIGAEKCRSLMKGDQMFRVGLIKGSCGWSYEFKFSNEKADNEVVFEDKGAKILVDKDAVDKLKGMAIDYVDGLQGAGFKILNPNVKGTCGCGSSVRL